MPKRKFTDKDYEEMRNKLRRLEKEVQRDKMVKRRRQRILSISSSSSADDSQAGESERDDIARQRQVSPVAVAHSPDQEQASAPPPDDQACTTSSEQGATKDSEAPAPPDPDLTFPIPEDYSPELDADILEILGVDPTKSENFGKSIQRDVAVRFEHTATNGLTKEDRKELMDKYLIPDNCKLVGAPVLNPEIKAALSETVIRRDAVIESKQKLTATAIASLGEAITLLLSSKEKNPDLLRLLIDTGRSLCDNQHNDTVTRRNFIIFSVKKDMKESLQNAKVDSFLFGKNLSETLKAAKAITKSGADLKPTSTPKPSTSKANLPSTSKNWRNFPPVRYPATATLRAKEQAARTPQATRGQRGNYSRRSQHQRISRSHR